MSAVRDRCMELSMALSKADDRRGESWRYDLAAAGKVMDEQAAEVDRLTQAIAKCYGVDGEAEDDGLTPYEQLDSIERCWEMEHNDSNRKARELSDCEAHLIGARRDLDERTRERDDAQRLAIDLEHGPFADAHEEPERTNILRRAAVEMGWSADLYPEEPQPERPSPKLATRLDAVATDVAELKRAKPG